MLAKVADSPGASRATGGEIVQRRTLPVGPERLIFNTGTACARLPGLVMVPVTSSTRPPAGNCVTLPATVTSSRDDAGIIPASVGPTTGNRVRSICPAHNPAAAIASASPRMIAAILRSTGDRPACSASSPSSPSGASSGVGGTSGTALSSGAIASLRTGSGGAPGATSGTETSGSIPSAVASGIQRWSHLAHFSREPRATTSSESR